MILQALRKHQSWMYSCIKINRKKIRAELLKVFKIKGYDFIQVQAI